MTAVRQDDDLTAIFDFIAEDDGDIDELAQLRIRYPWFAITRTRRGGWSASPIWLDQVVERIVAETMTELADKIDQRLGISWGSAEEPERTDAA